MDDITDRQLAVLRCIHRSSREHGYAPSIREIGAELEIASPKATHDHLKALEKKGFVTRTGQTSRAMVITKRGLLALGIEAETSETVLVPVIGRVAAGPLDLAEENLEESLRVDVSMVGGNGRDIFGLRIRGDSMIGDGIVDGSIVFVRKASTAPKGAIVIALLDDGATCKRYFPEGDQVRLQPSNPKVAPIYFKKSDVRLALILGVVVGVYRRFDEV